MRKTKLFTTLLAVVLCMAAFSMTAFASNGGYYQSDESGTATPPNSIDSITVSTENVALSGNQGSEALTPDGNLSLVDDIYQVTTYASDENELEAKQFITVESKNGNYFYIIIDRSGETENVYFLNLVDEYDLLSLIDEDTVYTTACSCTDKCVAGSVNTDCDICRTNMSECTGKEAVTDTANTDSDTADQPEDTEPDASGSKLGLLLIVLILAGVGGGFYYFKVLKNKPKPNTPNLDDYDLGDDDDEEYEVEDEEPETTDIEEDTI